MTKKNITKIEKKKVLERKLNVAAYARVSTGKDAMLHSLSSQILYYKNKIMAHDGWVYKGVYSDEAISGTKTDRNEFNKMIEECKQGNIDLIITKSISRFARNTLVLLETIKELKNYNVGVFFEEQNINSLSGEGEMVLTFLASFAQEEARSVSENMKWRVKRDFEKGLIYGSNNCLGYRIVNRKLEVVPEEAEIVRYIFNLYINGYGYMKICNELNSKGITTLKGNEWKINAIQKLLSNYNYTGDLMLQKTFKENYITKKQIKNRGQLDKYIVEKAHDPIIDLDTFNLVQEMKKAKFEKIDIRSEDINLLKGLIFCGECGSTLQRKRNQYRKIWVCSNFNQNGRKACSSKQIRDEILIQKTCEALGINKLSKKEINKQLEKIIVNSKQKKITFYLKTGHVSIVDYITPSRSEGWKTEQRDKARERAILQFNKEGKTNGSC